MDEFKAADDSCKITREKKNALGSSKSRTLQSMTLDSIPNLLETEKIQSEKKTFLFALPTLYGQTLFSV